MKEQRVIVTIFNGLYYRLELEEMIQGQWQKSRATWVCHESQLEDKIASIMRG